jgi:hypothetical protein
MHDQKTDQKNAAQPPKKELNPKYCQYGGTYFHSARIVGNKNVFVNDEYIDILTNALRMSEVRKDIKNLAYVIMPNYFLWMFRLSNKDNNPYETAGEMKGQVAFNVIKMLEEEMRSKPLKEAPIFRWNKRAGRSPADKILGVFSEEAKKMEGNQKHRFWIPKTELRLLENQEQIRQKLAVIKAAPTSERWQLVTTAEKYPYLYVSDEMLEEFSLVGDDSCVMQMPVMVPAMA